MTKELHGHVGQGPPVLDIGDDIGALVLLTPDSLVGQEIEVSPVDDDRRRTHTQVHRRNVAGRTLGVAVYPALPEGRYRICDDDPTRQHRVSIVGGKVAEVDWA
jgi:hypothetical protein